MEVALRQRLEGVAAVSISESAQTTEVIFAPGDHPFSIETFKGALRQASVEAVTMEIDVCGRLERHGGEPLLRTRTAEFVLRNGSEAFAGTSVCVAGRIAEEPGRVVLLVTRVDEADPANGS
jgi:hypothetical protein